MEMWSMQDCLTILRFCRASSLANLASGENLTVKAHSAHPKSCPGPEKPFVGGPFLETFQHYFRCVFYTFFRCAPRWSFFRCWCQTRSQTSAFGRRFHDFLGSGWTSENRALVWVLARFRGLEALPNRRIFRTFSCVLIGSHLQRHFVWF